MEVKIGAEYWKHLEDDLKRFAVAMRVFEKVHERLETQSLIVETIGSDAELERANKLAEKLGAGIKFKRQEAADNQVRSSERGNSPISK